MTTAAAFLSDLHLRSVSLPGNWPYADVGLALGLGNSALEVLVASAGSEPNTTTLRSAWKARHGRRPAPLLLVVLYGEKAAICGPVGDDAPAYLGVDRGQAERICREALNQPNRHAAIRELRGTLQSVETELPGIHNSGFLATHELAKGAKDLDAWPGAQTKSGAILAHRNDALLRSLGFEIEPADGVTSILRANGRKRAVAVLLNQSESPELQSERFSGLSPVSYALAVADRENLPYVLALQGPKLRLYPAKVGVGVGRRGRTETYVEVHTGLLRDAEAGYLWLLFSKEALLEGGTVDQLLEASTRFAGSLAEDLRDRIYEYVIPQLAEGLADARGFDEPTAQDLAETYEMAMTVLFRLLFIAYAEDKDLLPYRWNGLYKTRSLQAKAAELMELARNEVEFDESDSLWEEVLRLFRAVEKGNREWGVPEYDGGLFSSDPEISTVGSLLTEVSLPNTIFGPALQHLLLIETPEGPGPVDFRSLGVREFGTVYEGLLESELSVAETDLAVDDNSFYRPCREDEEWLVEQGAIYLHNRSGARKSSGTYYTKTFAVEHLLDQALEPALGDHLERLDKLDDDEAAEGLFDFRVADIAMGSGHFLVAAVDRIERRFSGYLAGRKLPGVGDELAKLHGSAIEALGPLAEQVEIEDGQLLRRLIARRCIYGVDINPTAVQLARLAIWIHTFVPGLPLSLLDHNLVCGNSLVGIGQISEIQEKAQEGDELPLFRLDARKLVGEALDPLNRLARIADTTAAEVQRARTAMEEARKAIAPAEALCDITTACRIEDRPLPVALDRWDEIKSTLAGSKEHRHAQAVLGGLSMLHFPIAFPEVFLRERAGFDVILGNPPWETMVVHEDEFWARHFPGLRGLSQQRSTLQRNARKEERPDLVRLFNRERQEAASLREALSRGPFPGMGVGDPDLYKAFCWRFWRLVSGEGGWIGVVLPRSVLAARGSKAFREEVFQRAARVAITMLINRRRWVFADVHPQYSIGLVGIKKKRTEDGTFYLRGPFSSFGQFDEGNRSAPSVFSSREVTSWTDSAALPLLPTDVSPEVFRVLRLSPGLGINQEGQWRARPYGEAHSAKCRDYLYPPEDHPDTAWPVWKGENFDLEHIGIGQPYGWADPKIMAEWLDSARRRQVRRSAYAEFPVSWAKTPEAAPWLHPRVALRDVARATDTRTVITALVPPNIFLTDKAPYLLFPRGSLSDQVFVYGILRSLPLDWYARRFVETGLKFYIINALPVPRPSPDSAGYLRIVELAGRLGFFDDRFRPWAEPLGLEAGPLDSASRQDQGQELDAIAAHLYGLEESHLIHIFETFHEGWDYEDRLQATLRHFRAWRSKLG